ncbi:MAG: hypothetical protein IJJ26_04510 [Victivallales bacterium]|nr:hypothetical protein [Victivallales bacterium]
MKNNVSSWSRVLRGMWKAGMACLLAIVCIHAVSMDLRADDEAGYVTYPVQNAFYRQDSDTFAIKIHLKPSDFEATGFHFYLSQYYYDEEESAVKKSGKLGAHFETDPSVLSDQGDGFVLKDNFNEMDVKWTELGFPGHYYYYFKVELSGATSTVYEGDFYFAETDDVCDAGEIIRDGDDPNEELDIYRPGTTTISANWDPFTEDNFLPAAARYEVIWADPDNEENVLATAETTETSASAEVELVDGDKWFVTVKAYDANGVILATATSNGFTAYLDVTPPTVTSVLDEGITGSFSTLTASWEATDDIGVTGYRYRLIENPNSLEWIADEGELSTARDSYGTVVVDGTIYIIGGMDGTSVLDTVETYDPETTSWTTLDATLNTGRADFATATTADGTIYVFGGYDNEGNIVDTIEAYADGAWTVCETPFPEEVGGLVGAQAIAVADNLIWIFGGYDASWNLITAVYEFDTEAGTITPVEGVNLSKGRSNFQVILQKREESNCIVVAGGLDETGAALSSIDILDVTNASASSINMDTARTAFALVTVPAVSDSNLEDVLLIGGQDANGAALDTVYRVSATGNGEKLTATMTTPRASCAAIWLSACNQLLVIGGVDSESNPLATTETAPADGSVWTEASNLTAETGRFGNAVALVGLDADETIVTYGGFSGGDFTTTTEHRLVIEVIQDWTETTEKSVTITDLDLMDGAIYIFQVEASDEEGNVSTVASSAGVTIDGTYEMIVLSCDYLEDGMETIRRTYTVNVSKLNESYDVVSYSYTLTCDNTEVASGTDCALDTPIEMQGLENVGAYVLTVKGKNGEEVEQQKDTTLSWTVTMPAIEVEEDTLPDDGAVVTENIPCGFNVSSDVTKLGILVYFPETEEEEPDWSKGLEVSVSDGYYYTNLDLHPNYDPKKAVCMFRAIYTDEVLGDIYSEVISRTYTVVKKCVDLAFNPEIEEGCLTATDELTVTVTDHTGAGLVTTYSYTVTKDGEDYVSEDDIDIDEPIELTALEAGEYVLSVTGEGVEEPETFTFNVVAATFASFSPEVDEPTTETDFTATVNLNGLASYKYQIDDGEIVEVTAAEGEEIVLTFDVTGLSTGLHTVNLWGVDSYGYEQTVPTVQEIQVKNDIPFGDRLTATITSDSPSVQDTETASFTVTFSEEIMAAPAISAFMVTNGTVSEVSSSEDGYTVSVTPDALAEGVSSQKLELSLLANQVYSKAKGTGNAASNTASILVYGEDPLLAFSLSAFAVDQDTLVPNWEQPIDDEYPVYKGDYFAVLVSASTPDAFVGGEVKLAFDYSRFTLVGPRLDATKPLDKENFDVNTAVLAPYNNDGTENDLSLTSADLAKDEGDITAVSISGMAILKGANGKKVVETSEDGAYFYLVFQAHKEDGAEDTDFTLEAGSGNLYLKDADLLVNGDTCIDYGEPMEIVVAAHKSTLRISGPEQVNIGDEIMVFVENDVEREEDLEITLKYTIGSKTTTLEPVTLEAGESSSDPVVFVAPGTPDTADYKLKLMFKSVSPSTKIASKKSYIIKVKNAFATLTLTTDTASVIKGENLLVTLTLSQALAEDINVTLTTTIGGTTEECGSVTIAAGETSADFNYQVPDDMKVTGDSTITFNPVCENRYISDCIGADVTIVDQYCQDISLAFSDGEIEEGQTSTLVASLPQGITAGEDLEFTMDVSKGSAVYGTDFILSDTIAIPKGQNSATVTLTSYDDGGDYGNKEAMVSLTAMTCGGVTYDNFTPVTASLVIRDNFVKPGDFDGNGVIDYQDYVNLTSQFGIAAGDPDFDPVYDLYPDGVIDYYDYVVLTSMMDEETRGEQFRAGEVATIHLMTDKTIIEVGQVFHLYIYMAVNSEEKGVRAYSVNVHFGENVAVDGSFDVANYLQGGLTYVPNGTLSDGAIIQLGGSINPADNTYATTVGLQNSDTLVAAIPFVATKPGKSELSIRNPLIGIKGVALSGDSVINEDVLSIEVIEAGSEFLTAIQTQYDSGMRSVEPNDELIFGMAGEASATPKGPVFPGIYSLSFKGGLSKDVREIADSATWTVNATVPAGATLTLDWSKSASNQDDVYSMPTTYIFSIANGDEAKDMRETTSILLDNAGGKSEQAFTLDITVTKRPAPAYSLTIPLTPGWNLIGVPCVLDEESNAAIAAMDYQVWLPESQAYVSTGETTFAPGQGVWLFAETASTITLKGEYAESTDVPLVQGWNLVAPIADKDNTPHFNPTKGSTTIPEVWYWTSTGNKRLLDDEECVIGRGYWLYSNKNQTLQPKTNP